MHKLATVTVTFGLLTGLSLQAAPKADQNRDGRVDRHEVKQAVKVHHKAKAVVDTPREAAADKNKDGVVGPRENAAARREAYLENRSSVDKPWEQRADANGDGKVDGTELKGFWRARLDKNGDGLVDATERRAHWIAWKSKVNTPAEKAHDADGDGFLSGEEARAFLRDRLRLIMTHGRAQVDTELERQFDANGDGILDATEAAALRDAIED